MKAFESATVGCRPLMDFRTKFTKLEPDGRTQHVAIKRPSKEICTTSRARENSLDRKISSPTNLQFTVHLNRNRLVSSKAREMYPTKFSWRKGIASRTYMVSADRSVSPRCNEYSDS